MRVSSSGTIVHGRPGSGADGYARASLYCSAAARPAPAERTAVRAARASRPCLGRAWSAQLRVKPVPRAWRWCNSPTGSSERASRAVAVFVRVAEFDPFAGVYVVRLQPSRTCVLWRHCFAARVIGSSQRSHTTHTPTSLVHPLLRHCGHATRTNECECLYEITRKRAGSATYSSPSASGGLAAGDAAAARRTRSGVPGARDVRWGSRRDVDGGYSI